MIFSKPLDRLVISGRKTETRRPVKHDGAGRLLPCRFKPGRDYAVQRGRGKPEFARIHVISVDGPEPVGRIDQRAAQGEGFKTTTAFRHYWMSLYDAAWPLVEPWRRVRRGPDRLLPRVLGGRTRRPAPCPRARRAPVRPVQRGRRAARRDRRPGRRCALPRAARRDASVGHPLRARRRPAPPHPGRAARRHRTRHHAQPGAGDARGTRGGGRRAPRPALAGGGSPPAQRRTGPWEARGRTRA